MKRQQVYIQATSLLLIFLNLSFLYFFDINLKGIAYSLFYGLFAIMAPGWLTAYLFLREASNSANPPFWPVHYALSLLFGIAGLTASYFAFQWLKITPALFLFLLPFLLLLSRHVRGVIGHAFRPSPIYRNLGAAPETPTILFWVLCTNIFFFLMRPTPGLVALDIFHDHVWNAGNTAWMTHHFPLQSTNIETMPRLGYHVLIHIVGAHMALLTNLPAHMVGLQYVFIPLIPLLVVAMAAVIRVICGRHPQYFFYGLAVLLFGGGFHIVHAVKVSNLGSSSNFIGVLMLFICLSLILQLDRLRPTPRYVAVFLSVFLATAAKGSVGLAVTAGFGLWFLLSLWRRTLNSKDCIDAAVAGAGFLSSYGLFFWWPVMDQPVAADFYDSSGFPILPFAYVLKNDLAGPIVPIITKYFSGIVEYTGIAILFLVVLPIHIVLYYSYRLTVLHYARTYGIELRFQRILLVAAGAMLAAYVLNTGGAQDHAYFLNSALYVLDVFFILLLVKDALFDKLGLFFRKKQLYALCGAVFLLILPFLTAGGWIRSEHLNNFFMYGRIGQALDSQLAHTSYRRQHSGLSPELYEALQFIRESSSPEAVVVSPIIYLSDGRPLAFYTSAFSERPTFIEGHKWASIRKYIGPKEINHRLDVIDTVFDEAHIPVELLAPKYIYLVPKELSFKLQRLYDTTVLYKNEEWHVLQAAATSEVK